MIVQFFTDSKGNQFISVKNYKSVKTGEISDFTININSDYGKKQIKDLNWLKSLTDSDLIDFSKNTVVSLETMQKAHSELIKSLEKNISSDKTPASISQSEAYKSFAPNIRVHLETQKFHIFGFLVNKTVKVAGEYPKVNKQKKTIAKDILRKQMFSTKFRTFIFDQIEGIKGNKQVITD